MLFSYQLYFPSLFSAPWVLNLIYCRSFNCLPHASLRHWHFLMNLSFLGPHTEVAPLTIGAARPLIVFPRFWQVMTNDGFAKTLISDTEKDNLCIPWKTCTVKWELLQNAFYSKPNKIFMGRFPSLVLDRRSVSHLQLKVHLKEIPGLNGLFHKLHNLPQISLHLMNCWLWWKC